MKSGVPILIGLFLLSGGFLWAGDVPEGETVKVSIGDEMLKGELLSVTPELIVIRQKDKDDNVVVLGCPTNDTEIVTLRKKCGPIGAILFKKKKFKFAAQKPEVTNENLNRLAYYALYGKLIPDYIKEVMKPYVKS